MLVGIAIRGHLFPVPVLPAGGLPAVLLEVVEECGHAVECGLSLSFYLDAKLHTGLADAPQVFDAVERSDQADAAAGLDGLAKPHLVHAVIDEHGDVSHLDDLLPEVRQERECEVAVGDGAPVGTFLGRPLGIDVYPLVVECGVGKEVDALLGDLKPLRLAELLAQVGGKFVVGRDDEFIHSYILICCVAVGCLPYCCGSSVRCLGRRPRLRGCPSGCRRSSSSMRYCRGVLPTNR